MTRTGLRDFFRVAFLAILLVLVFVFLTPKTEAAINPQINFQGKLTNTDGTNVTNGTYSILFSIYTVASGGSSIWSETQGSVSVTDGIFRVSLGSVTGLPGSVDFNSNSLHLGIKIGADPEMTPRVQFTAAPYAFNSSQLGGISSTGFVQLGLAAAQTDGTTNSLIFLNKTSTGSLVQLQQGAVDKFVVSNAGIITTASVNAASVVPDTLDFTELKDALALDAATTIALGANVLNINLDSTGNFTIQDAGATFLTIDNTGAYSFTLDATDNPAYTITNAGSSNINTNLSGTGDFTIQDNGVTFLTVTDTGAYIFSLDATDNPAYSITNSGTSNITQNLAGTGDFEVQDNGTSFFTLSDTGAVSINLDATDNPAYTVTNAGSSNVTYNLSGSGDFVVQDNGTPAFVVQDNGGVYIGDPATAIATGSLLVLDSITADPGGVAGGMYYNSAQGKFRCYENAAWKNCIAPPTNALITAGGQVLAASSTTYLTGSVIDVPPSGLQAGTTFSWTVIMSKTAAGTVVNNFDVRVGTLGTVADASRLNFAMATQTAVADTAVVTITATLRNTGAAAILVGNYRMAHNLAATGFDNALINKTSIVTSAAFDSTPASLKVGLSYTTGAAYAITVQQLIVTTTNL